MTGNNNAQYARRRLRTRDLKSGENLVLPTSQDLVLSPSTDIRSRGPKRLKVSTGILYFIGLSAARCSPLRQKKLPRFFSNFSLNSPVAGFLLIHRIKRSEVFP